jgi:hypothetical protein
MHNEDEFPIPITYGEYEARRFAQGLRKCRTCKKQLDTADVGVTECYGCYVQKPYERLK